MAHTTTTPDSLGALEGIAQGDVSLADLMGLSPSVLGQVVEQALALAEAGRLADAERLLTQIALVDAESPMLTLLLGSIRAESGDYPAAVAAYDETLDRHVRSGGRARFEVELRLLRARALLGNGRVEDAQLDLLLAAAGPDRDVARGAQALLTAIGAGS